MDVAMQKNYRPSGVGMMAAEPGTYLLHAYFDDNQVDLVRCNVIGWKVGNDSRIAPLVIDPRAADGDNWYVQHPDGRIENPNGQAWNTLNEWIDDLKREQREAA